MQLLRYSFKNNLFFTRNFCDYDSHTIIKSVNNKKKMSCNGIKRKLVNSLGFCRLDGGHTVVGRSWRGAAALTHGRAATASLKPREWNSQQAVWPDTRRTPTRSRSLTRHPHPSFIINAIRSYYALLPWVAAAATTLFLMSVLISCALADNALFFPFVRFCRGVNI